MIITSSDVLDVPVALATVLTIREANSYARSVFLHNLTSGSDLAMELQYSNDGGTSWSIIDTAFTLAAGELITKEIESTYGQILRLRASGGGDDRDLHITYARIFDDNQHNWVMPIT